MVPAEGDNDTSETTAAIAEAARPAPAVGPLAEDVACIGCGYNLRGLASTGRCPECGRPAQGSVALHRARRKAPPPPDPRWARQVAEGAGLSLLAFVLFAVLCLAPQQWFYLPYRYAPVRDTPGRTTDLHFPSYGKDAATMLVRDRRVAAIGVDTPSIDHGPSQDFPVHRVVAAANVMGLENVDNLEALPPTGAWIVALPMKIGGGSGGPLRIVALLAP